MRDLGNRAEALAADFLLKKGYRILQRNYRLKSAEIDIIAMDGETLVFVEVKSRSYARFGNPAEAVDHKKRARIRQAALHYLSRQKREYPARFDVISILPGGIEHIPDAFEVN